MKKYGACLIVVGILSIVNIGRAGEDLETYENLRLKTSLQEQEIRFLRRENEDLKQELKEYRLKEKVQHLQEEVSHIRGLPIKKPLQTDFIKKEELKDYVDREIKRQYPGKNLASYQEVLIRLGLLPPGTDIRKRLIALFQEQAAGFYDDVSEKFFIVEEFDLNETVSNIILSHEICHALQDQNYDLQSMNLFRQDNDDKVYALLSVLEGDATILMSEWLKDNFRLGSVFHMFETLGIDQSTYTNAPYFLQQLLIFPYIQGSRFLMEVMGRHGMAGRDLPFKVPPHSTEQIIHPEKYLYHIDLPTTVSLSTYAFRLGKEWKKEYENTLGEMGFKFLFEQYQDMAESYQGAAGWDGDRYGLFRRQSGHFLICWESVWDTLDDAEEASMALKQVFRNRYRITGEMSGEQGWQVECREPKGGEEAFYLSLSRSHKNLTLRFTNDPFVLDHLAK